MNINEHFILDYIPFGVENAVTRKSLCERLNMSDRAVRQLIEAARRAGAIIVNNQDGRGYYQSEDTEDLLAHYKQEKARAMKILMHLTPVRRELKSRGVSVKW